MNSCESQCAASRSRSLLPAVTLAIQTGLRDEELRSLKWKHIDLLARAVTVGKSKTEHGTGRVIPLNKTAMAAITEWAQQFPDRTPAHYVFPSEKVGFSGNDEIPQGLRYHPYDGDHVVEGGMDDGTHDRRRDLSNARLAAHLHHASA